MRGGTGAKSMRATLIEGQWKSIQYLCNGENELLKRMAEVMKEQMKNSWMKELVGELRTERMTSMGEVTNEKIRQRE